MRRGIRSLYSVFYPDINQAHGTGSGNNYNLSQTIITGSYLPMEIIMILYPC